MKSKVKRTRPNKPATVEIKFDCARARSVQVAGSFNDWQAIPLEAIAPGRWARTIALPPGVYEYRFVVDGEWVDDPRAQEHMPNVFGSCNAVLRVSV